ALDYRSRFPRQAVRGPGVTDSGTGFEPGPHGVPLRSLGIQPRAVPSLLGHGPAAARRAAEGDGLARVSSRSTDRTSNSSDTLIQSPSLSVGRPLIHHAERLDDLKRANILYHMVKCLNNLSEVFAALADPTRRQILDRLSRDRVSVTDLATARGVTLAAILK